MKRKSGPFGVTTERLSLCGDECCHQNPRRAKQKRRSEQVHREPRESFSAITTECITFGSQDAGVSSALQVAEASQESEKEHWMVLREICSSLWQKLTN